MNLKRINQLETLIFASNSNDYRLDLWKAEMRTLLEEADKAGNRPSFDGYSYETEVTSGTARSFFLNRETALKARF